MTEISNSYKQTLYVIWINQILFVIASLMLGWSCLPVAVIALFVFGWLSEASLHRYFAHKSFTTTAAKENILRVFALMTGQGATISWVTTHRLHHTFADTDKDPHSPLYHAWWRIMLGLYPQENIRYSRTLIKDLMHSPAWRYHVYEERYYWLIWTLIWIVSLSVSVWLFYFIVSGSALWFIMSGIINVVAHKKYLGVQTFPDAVATNSSLLSVITSIGYHNNHHKFPTNHICGIQGQTDIAARFIEKFFVDKQHE
jgi:stearoyl-CoA desaturase (delta-9 desaturase)